MKEHMSRKPSKINGEESTYIIFYSHIEFHFTVSLLFLTAHNAENDSENSNYHLPHSHTFCPHTTNTIPRQYHGFCHLQHHLLSIEFHKGVENGLLSSVHP